MSELKVSIIVPVYNDSKYLRRCLDSCVNQTMTEIEVIVVNDCSPDPLDADIMREYETAFPDKIKCFWHTENKGAGEARNTGLRAAKGDYLNFVDSDDYIDLQMCEKLYREAETNNADYVYCDHYEVRDSVRYFIRFNELDENCQRNVYPIFGVVASIVKREIFAINNLYFPNVKYCEDSLTTLMLLILSKNRRHLTEALYYRCLTQGSLTQTSTLNDNCLEYYKAVAQMRKLGEGILAEDEMFLFDLKSLAFLFDYLFIIYAYEHKRNVDLLAESAHRHSINLFTEYIHNHKIDMVKIITSIRHNYKREKARFLWNLINHSVDVKTLKSELLGFDITYIKQALARLTTMEKDVIVWGAGERGTRLCAYLRKAGILFEVTDIQASIYNKKELKPWETLKEQAGLVIVTPRFKFDEIKAQIDGGVPVIDMEEILF